MLKFLDKTGLDTFWAKIKSTFQTLGNLVTAWGSTPSDTKYPSEKLVKTTLDGKSSTSHTHSVSINGSTKTIAASGGTAVDLGTYKVFNYARVFPMQPYNANTNRYILIASKTATYTHNWEESSMFKLVVHDGLVPKELVFRLWLYGYVSSGSVPSDPSNPKLYRLCAENFSDSELNILDVRMLVVEKSSGSITFTIGIFIDRNYLPGPHVSYQLYPLSYGTRDRGNTIDNGLSSWTYTVGYDVYSDLHDSFTMAFAVSELPIRMIATTASDFDTSGGTIKSSLEAKVDIESAGVVATSNSHWDIIMRVATIASNGIHYKRWLCKSDGTSAFVDYRPNSDNASFMLEAYAVKWNSYEDCKYKLLYWRAGKQTPYVAELIFNQAQGMFPATITWYDTSVVDSATTATNYNTSSGTIKTALDGKVSSIKKNGATITPSDGVADIGYMPVTGTVSTATVQGAIQALRVIPGGKMGSVELNASTVGSTTIRAAWYNYIWIPHRTGAAVGDNQNYGTLILTPMTSTPAVYVIEGSGLNTSSPTYRITSLQAALPTTGAASTTYAINVSGDAQSVRGLYITKTIVNDPNAIIFF